MQAYSVLMLCLTDRYSSLPSKSSLGLCDAPNVSLD